MSVASFSHSKSKDDDGPAQKSIKDRPLKVNDVVSVPALVWGKEWAKAAFPNSWQTARFTGTVVEKCAGNKWKCDFEEEDEADRGVFNRKALQFESRPGEDAAELAAYGVDFSACVEKADMRTLLAKTRTAQGWPPPADAQSAQSAQSASSKAASCSMRRR